MLLSKTVKIKWNSKIKNHYVNLGYTYTKMNDEFIVNVEDLTRGSSARVYVECDYCKKMYQKYWYNYIQENENSTIHKDSCNECKSLKAKESVQKTYNCDNVFQLQSVKEKITETCLEKYGTFNPFQSEIVKEKIKETNIEKYGFENAMQSPILKNKRREYCLKKYGIPYMPQLDKTHKKGKLNPRWIGGAEVNGFYRSTYEYRDWHKYVMERDNYTCQCCGKRNGNGKEIKFHVHHIFNFADNKDLMYENDNGICLCTSCHKLFHSIYGYKNTNKTQLENFILNHGKNIC